MNNIDLNGRFAVITGGAQGVGYAVAQRIIASGGRVALWDIDPGVTAAAETLSAGTIGIVLDLTDEHAVAAAAEETERLFGRIDILVNSAGIAGSPLPVVTYSAKEWRRVIDVDLTAVFLCCRAVVAGMTSRNYGRIVNVSSVAGKEGNPNAAPYSAAKAGVIALTKSLGKELAASNIAVNCITPSPIKTRMLEQVSPEHIKYMLSRVPRGRFAELQEAASMIAWLVSEENSFTTASTFDLSGGRATY
jgi:NAD(P)-dependent dehydrogenase (short-subunit alcohol dehydrogenase family)